MPYLHVKWNSSDQSLPADVSVIRPCPAFDGYSRNEGLCRRRWRVLGCSGESGKRQTIFRTFEGSFQDISQLPRDSWNQRVNAFRRGNI